MTAAAVPAALGLAALAAGHRALIVDLWGVVHDGAALLPGAAETLKSIRAAGKPVVFLTNSARRQANLVALLDRLGLDRSLYRTVVSSGEAAAMALSDAAFCRTLGGRYVVIGRQEDGAWVHALPAEEVENPADADFALATGLLDDDTTDETWAPMFADWLARGVPLVCANPDLQVVHDGRLRRAGGALAKAFREAGGRVLLYGKPDRPIYDACFAALPDIPRRAVLAVGDSLATDIAGAAAAGLDSVLVTETGLPGGGGPAGVRPTATIPRFAW